MAASPLLRVVLVIFVHGLGRGFVPAVSLLDGDLRAPGEVVVCRNLQFCSSFPAALTRLGFYPKSIAPLGQTPARAGFILWDNGVGEGVWPDTHAPCPRHSASSTAEPRAPAAVLRAHCAPVPLYRAPVILRRNAAPAALFPNQRFQKIKDFKSKISIFFFSKTKISGTPEAPRSSCEPGRELLPQTRAPGGSSLARARSLFLPGESFQQHTPGPWL